GRLEALAVDGDRPLELRRREMGGEGVGQAEHRGELCTVETGAENPDRYVEPLARHGAYTLAFLCRCEVVDQLDHIVGEVVHVARQIAAQRPGRKHVGAGRAAEAKVDAAGMKGSQRAEQFGTLAALHPGRTVRRSPAEHGWAA